MKFHVSKTHSDEQKTVLVDIDETICFYKGERRYDQASPSVENIEKINTLYEEGWKVIYWSARGCNSGIDYRDFTVQQLESWGCKFHDLICGKNKGHFDMLIDDKSKRIEEISVVKNSLDRQYTDLLKTILEHGVEKKDRTGTGTLSLFGYTIRHNMQEGFPLLTTKKMAWKQIVTELLWFLRGDTNIKFLIDNGCYIWNGDAIKNYEKHNGEIDWGPFITKEEAFAESMKDPEFVKKWGNLGPIYGKQWRDWNYQNKKNHYVTPGQPSHNDNHIDQIAELISELKTNPDSRRLMVSAWNVGELSQMVLPPCHYGFQVYTRELTWEERVQWVMKNTQVEWENVYITEEVYKETTPTRAISLMWNQRSVDTFLGLPFNIASYGLLLEIIAKIVNMVPDQLVGNLGDTHLYSNHLDQAREQLKRRGHSLPQLSINTEFWPTESQEAGVGPLHHDLNFLIENMQIEDFQVLNYQSEKSIKAPLSN